MCSRRPREGRVFESRPDIHKDYPAEDFRAANSVWNARVQTVSLKAARNEFVAFQVIIEAPQPVTGVNVRFPGVAGPGGAKIAANTRRLSRSGTFMSVNLRPVMSAARSVQAWYPDALMPQRHDEYSVRVPFSIPDLYNNIPGQKNQALWIDLFVPEDRAAAPPGTVHGRSRGHVERRPRELSKLRSTSGISRCRRRTTFPATFGMARCVKCRPRKNWRITNWRASIDFFRSFMRIGPV